MLVLILAVLATILVFLPCCAFLQSVADGAEHTIDKAQKWFDQGKAEQVGENFPGSSIKEYYF